MSVATEWEPIVEVPERARRTQRTSRSGAAGVPGASGFQAPQRGAAIASVTTLHRPPAAAFEPQLRLTRRGVHAVAAAVAVLAVGLVLLARASAPSASAAGSASSTRLVPDTVTVQAGDTLWSIASRLAPQRDPRAEIADLQRLNRLGGVALVPGQVLRTH